MTWLIEPPTTAPRGTADMPGGSGRAPLTQRRDRELASAPSVFAVGTRSALVFHVGVSHGKEQLMPQ